MLLMFDDDGHFSVLQGDSEQIMSWHVEDMAYSSYFLMNKPK